MSILAIIHFTEVCLFIPNLLRFYFWICTKQLQWQGKKYSGSNRNKSIIHTILSNLYFSCLKESILIFSFSNWEYKFLWYLNVPFLVNYGDSYCCEQTSPAPLFSKFQPCQDQMSIGTTSEGYISFPHVIFIIWPPTSLVILFLLREADKHWYLHFPPYQQCDPGHNSGMEWGES